VKIGERVEAGQRLGAVGRTGIRDSGPHLHFGLFENGEVRDPLVYLAAYLFPPKLTKRGGAELASAHRHPGRKERYLRGSPSRSAGRATDRRSPAPRF
jgi:murein DD-endopeptidase MepM/ murein hydrolase activator NlpD